MASLVVCFVLAGSLKFHDILESFLCQLEKGLGVGYNKEGKESHVGLFIPLVMRSQGHS